MLTSHYNINKMSNLNCTVFDKCIYNITPVYTNETNNRAVVDAINPFTQFKYHHSNNTYIIRYMFYLS